VNPTNETIHTMVQQDQPKKEDSRHRRGKGKISEGRRSATTISKLKSAMRPTKKSRRRISQKKEENERFQVRTQVRRIVISQLSATQGTTRLMQRQMDGRAVYRQCKNNRFIARASRSSQQAIGTRSLGCSKRNPAVAVTPVEYRSGIFSTYSASLYSRAIGCSPSRSWPARQISAHRQFVQ
jgi:hypothetical protein